jgi:hypothetical protein
VRSINHTAPDSPEDEPTRATRPDHGTVGVFQAPQPVPARGTRPAARPPDNLDIDSPFLDLFGSEDESSPAEGAAALPGAFTQPAREPYRTDRRPYQPPAVPVPDVSTPDDPFPGPVTSAPSISTPAPSGPVPSGTATSATAPSAPVPSGTGASGTGASGTGASGTGGNGTGGNGTGGNGPDVSARAGAASDEVFDEDEDDLLAVLASTTPLPNPLRSTPLHRTTPPSSRPPHVASPAERDVPGVVPLSGRPVVSDSSPSGDLSSGAAGVRGGQRTTTGGWPVVPSAAAPPLADAPNQHRTPTAAPTPAPAARPVPDDRDTDQHAQPSAQPSAPPQAHPATSRARTTPDDQPSATNHTLPAHPRPTDPELTHPVAAEPAFTRQPTAHPTAAQPVSAQPVSAQPVSAQPMSVQPVSAQPGSAEPMSPQTVWAHPVSAQPTSAPPVQEQSAAAQPVSGQTRRGANDVPDATAGSGPGRDQERPSQGYGVHVPGYGGYGQGNESAQTVSAQPLIVPPLQAPPPEGHLPQVAAGPAAPLPLPAPGPTPAAPNQGHGAPDPAVPYPVPAPPAQADLDDAFLGDLDLGWPDTDEDEPQGSAVRQRSGRSDVAPTSFAVKGDEKAPGQGSGVLERAAGVPLQEQDHDDEKALATREDTRPARRRSAQPARRRRGEAGEPENLPAVRKELKPPGFKPHKLRFTDRDPSVELEITEIAGHLTFTPGTVTAWYALPEVRWAFRPDAEREALLSAISEQYAGLAGFRLHLRRTTRPFPADEWARTIDKHTARPLPDVVGGTSWSDHLVAAQRHLLAVNHAEGQTYLGVTFARRSIGDTFAERVMRLFGKGTSDSERRKLGRTVEQFDEVLNAFGMRGRRVTPQELEWLLFRSVALCMAPPGPLSPVSNGQWERGDLLALTEQVERYRSPYGSTVKLVNRMTGEERHVAVLTVGRMEPLEIPERHEPWMHFHERLPWPMELSSRVDILGSTHSFKNLEHRLRMIRSQQLDYAEHGIDAPPELERLAKRALVIGDEMTTGLPVESARAHGWHRLAVGGRTREECLERARRLIQLYARELRISLQHAKNQDQLAREFIPGEPIANTGYVRRMPVKLLAAALPQAASTVGDRRGDLIGRTAGTCRRPVFLDLHFPMEVRERSGLSVFVAEPGGGKSTLMGALGYLNARRGVQVTLLDPSGPLARLCQMPELRPHSRVLNLTGSEQGTLAPYSLIPTPVRSEFATGPTGDREYEIAVSNSRAERRMLVQDICSMLIPAQVAREASTATLLRHAVRGVPAEETSTLDDVVTFLQGLDSDGQELANLLLDTAEMPLALLFFGRPPSHLLSADSALTVITMAGLRLPDMKIEREYWSAEESLALPMLHTAHRLAVRRCYGGSMSARKMVGLDEAHFMEGWRSGRSFLVRLARDSRKWNLAALVASQNPKDILGLDVQNLVSTVFVGRIAEDQEIASEALRLLRVPVNDGYEATLASLSQADTSSSTRLGFREFVMRDVDGRVQKVRVDVSYVDGLLEHLDTTPGAPLPSAAALPAAAAAIPLPSSGREG